jgi:hypothetical protein
MMRRGICRCHWRGTVSLCFSRVTVSFEIAQRWFLCRRLVRRGREVNIKSLTSGGGESALCLYNNTVSFLSTFSCLWRKISRLRAQRTLLHDGDVLLCGNHLSNHQHPPQSDSHHRRGLITLSSSLMLSWRFDVENFAIFRSNCGMERR